MLANLLYWIVPYQIFNSVSFRSGLTYLTAYVLITYIMPRVIRLFREKGIHSDFTPSQSSIGPYQGATPIMGGLVIIPSILISALLWVWLNPYVLSLLFIMFSFAVIGGLDDMAKVRHKAKILSGKEEKKSFADKADGISAKARLIFESLFVLLVIAAFFLFFENLDGHLYIPMVPMKTWFPDLPQLIFIPLILFIIVGGANAVNLTDGLDSLATVPLITCTFFAGAAAYISGDFFWSSRLKILFISPDIKEVTVLACAILGACIAFLKFNSPPASIYMGDIGALGLGSVVCTMFVFVKAELYLPIVGGSFIVSALSTILQKIWFKFALWKKGRSWAEKNRLFYRAPYHHHQQMLFTYKEKGNEVESILYKVLSKIGIGVIPDEDKYLTKEQVNNKVIWKHHIRAVWLLVISLIIYFKVR